MKAELKKFPAYQPAELPWIGEIPVGWEAVQLARLNTKLTNGFVGPTRDILRQEGVRYLQSLHITDGRISFHQPYFVSEDWSSEHPKSILKTGDVLIAQTGADTGQVAAVTQQFAGCNCHALIIISCKPMVVDGFFLSALLRSHYGYHSLRSARTGALHPHLNCTKVRELMLPIPPLDQQRAILAFLDRETAKIDRLTDVRRKQLELLEEQRTAVIHHAVTKGLDPTSKMTASNVDWLGKVPASWGIHRLRRTTAKEVNGYWGDDPVNIEDPNNIICIRVADFDRPCRSVDSGEKTIRLISPSKRNTRLLTPGDLLLEKSGGGEKSPVGCVVLFNGTYQAVTSNFVAKMTPNPEYDAQFLCYVHQALYDERVTMLSVKQTTGIQNLDSFAYLNERAAFPGKTEQQAIVVYLQHETGKIDALATRYRCELELLAEYRSSLISHAVTGRIDVRGLVQDAEPELMARI